MSSSTAPRTSSGTGPRSAVCTYTSRVVPATASVRAARSTQPSRCHSSFAVGVRLGHRRREREHIGWRTVHGRLQQAAEPARRDELRLRADDRDQQAAVLQRRREHVVQPRRRHEVTTVSGRGTLDSSESSAGRPTSSESSARSAPQPTPCVHSASRGGIALLGEHGRAPEHIELRRRGRGRCLSSGVAEEIEQRRRDWIRLRCRAGDTSRCACSMRPR